MTTSAMRTTYMPCSLCTDPMACTGHETKLPALEDSGVVRVPSAWMPMPLFPDPDPRYCTKRSDESGHDFVDITYVMASPSVSCRRCGKTMKLKFDE